MDRHRFPIGTQYQSRSGAKCVCTVVDHLTTTNSKGEIVKLGYVTSHQFCGQTVEERDVVDTTIARGLLPQFVHLLGKMPSVTPKAEGEGL